MALEFTPGQRQAITGRGTSLLVSAAAGSGKTRVLIERLMRYVTDPENPRDIDSFLIITYTRAAAAQLKSRVSGALAALAAEHPDDSRLRRQQNLSYRAQISTIHSFCTTLLRENCQYLGLPPGFSVLEGDKERVLRQTVLERVLDARYEKIDSHPGFAALVDTVGAGRDDSRLAALVPELWQKLRSHPYPEDWAAEQMSALTLDGVTDAGQTPWGRELLEPVLASAQAWRARMEDAAGKIRSAGGKIEKAYLASFEGTCLALDDFAAALARGWDAASARLPIPFSRLGPLKNYDDPALADEVKSVRASCKKAAEGWAASLSGTSAELLEDMRAMAPASRALLELTLDFDRAFAAEKKRRGCVDFSDLEHMAARLLVDKDSGVPTWIARETMQRYTEIMVDEYQDVNPVQELIFTALSRPGGNLFLVGDVKQSIYRFRLADPSIFMRKSRDWPDVGAADGDKNASGGRRILLRENFRSRRGVLRAVNHVFSNIMSRELGELDYDDSAALRYGAVGYPEDSGAAVELDIIDPAGTSGLDADETPEKAAAEAEFVAGKINELISSGAPVYENGVPRRCGYGDFALLLRSPSANGAVFRQKLASAGIPVQARQGGGFFSSLEVTTALNLLYVVDNPHADVPLISVLRSPAFAFSPDGLAAVRARAREGDFYCALRAAAADGDEKSAGFLHLLDSLRDAAPELGVCGLLRRIYDETDLLALCSAMNSPSGRRGNLTRLFELAQEFENGGESGILRFTAKLRRMAERGEEPAVGGEGECVRIMSIHKSKGLEFPFVFLCDLSHGFNRSDLNAAVLLHTDLGLGPRLTDAARGIEYPTLARRAIAARLTGEMLSEEMRVLYVGMTRARERLFMTCTLSRELKSALELPEGSPGPVAQELLRTGACFARWLTAAARVGDGGGIALNMVTPGGEAEAENSAAAEPAPVPEPGGELYGQLCARLDWRYPFQRAVSLPSKLTATGLKGRADDAERMDDAVLAAAAAPEAVPEPGFRRAELGAAPGTKASAAERGTATHALLQRMDLSLAADETGARAELERLRQSGILTPEQAGAVDVRAVTRFGKSALCRRLLGAQELRREFRFTLLAEAADYLDGAPEGERLLLQGVVDCFIVEDGAITVIDYKTDRVTADEASARAETYAAQLETYARALERIRGLPVREKLVYFLTPGVCVKI